MRGSTITFICPPGLVLTGSNIHQHVWGMENGNLILEKRSVHQQIIVLLYMTSSTQRSFEVLSQNGKIFVASSLTVFADCCSVLHHWFSMWTLLSKEEEIGC